MRKIILILGFVLVFSLCAYAQENLTITTYYPSPSGSYNQLQAQRLGVGDTNRDGTFDNNDIPFTDGEVWIREGVSIGRAAAPGVRLRIAGLSTAANPFVDATVGIEATAAGAAGSLPGISFCRHIAAGGCSPRGALGLAGVAFNWVHEALAEDFVLTTGIASPGRLLLGTNDIPAGLNHARVTIMPNTGNVGIGTTTPGNILTVVQTSATDPIADAWTTYSSRRWKTNIQPITAALDKVMALRGVYFDWRADGKHDIGMIAEEVGEVIPEVVQYEENGKDAKSLDYSRLAAVFVEAIKELKAEKDALKTRIDALEAKRIVEAIP